MNMTSMSKNNTRRTSKGRTNDLMDVIIFVYMGNSSGKWSGNKKLLQVANVPILVAWVKAAIYEERLDPGSRRSASAENEHDQHDQKQHQANIKGANERFDGSHNICVHG
jgi:hypothetical protein